MIINDDWIYDQLWRLASVSEQSQELPATPPEAFRRMLAIARIQGVLGVILDKLRHQTPACPETWEIAQRAWHGEVVQSMRVRRHAEKVVKSLNVVGIPAVSFKGGDFADHLYPQPKVRPTFDVDILVPRDRWRESCYMLRAIGHSEKSPQPPMFLSTGVISERTWIYPSTSDIEVDLHWSLVHFPFFRRQASVEFWNLDWNWQVNSAGTVKGSLTPASRLVIAAVHAVYHHQFDRLLLLTDIQGACHRIDGPIETQRVRALVERTGTELALDVALRVTARFLNDPRVELLRQQLVPRGVNPRLVPEPLFADARQNLRSIKTHFNTLGRRRMREWLLEQPNRPEPGWEFKPPPPPPAPLTQSTSVGTAGTLAHQV